MALRDRLFPWARRDEEPPAALRAALDDLATLASRRPELSAGAAVLGRVLRAAFRTRPLNMPPTPHADSELILAAWRAGVPAFRAGDAPPLLDPSDLRERGKAVCRAVGPDHPNSPRLAAALASGAVDLHADWLAVLAGNVEENEARAAAADVDPPLVRSVLRLAVLPPLALHSAALDAIRPEGLWSSGECPNCGEPPILAESRGLEQRRHWRCGLCAGDWPGARLRCPFCGETDHRRLHYRYVEGEQDHRRLALCDTCGGQIKVVSTLGPLSAPGLLVAELATAHLDGLGRDEGIEPSAC